MTIRSRAIHGIFVLTSMLVGSSQAGEAPVALENPIPEKIQQGDIVVRAVPFLQVPRTQDPHDRSIIQEGISIPLHSSKAYARLQYMLPIRDGSGRLAISDIRGLLYVTDSGGKRLSTYLDLRISTKNLSDVFPNETGLLGFAFHPDFANEGKAGYGKLYTAYSATSDGDPATYLEAETLSHYSVIREWTTSDPGADTFTGTSREIFRVGQFAQSHNIATLSFNPYVREGSPDYGLLFVSMGDGGSAYDPNDYGQSLQEPLGAILRIDPLPADSSRKYGIPQDNPFIGRKKVAPEIWAYGLRHPQQFSFDTDGRMFINDIGQNHIEEVNIGEPGANYGWRTREGTFASGYGLGIGISGFVFNEPANNVSFVDPIAEYDHDEGNAIGSGFVYRGQDIPALQGKYVAADIVQGRLFYFDVGDVQPGRPAQLKELRIHINGAEQPLLRAVGYENSYDRNTLRADLRLGIDDAGELYLLTKGDGWIRKLAAME
ncbi:MAG: PQQ-dependent sugar dehydrogenase [Proteobacteria bacterium]|nr:PQQ-dependent sugar dehydrogenase [Pseudomonadota bacterium]